MFIFFQAFIPGKGQNPLGGMWKSGVGKSYETYGSTALDLVTRKHVTEGVNHNRTPTGNQGMSYMHKLESQNKRQSMPGFHKCPECSKCFRGNSGLRLHMQSHTGQFSFWCDECQRGFSVKGNYKHHMAKHEGRTFPCDLCNKRFQSKLGLQKHQQKLHPHISMSYIWSNCPLLNCHYLPLCRCSWIKEENKYLIF